MQSPRFTLSKVFETVMRHTEWVVTKPRRVVLSLAIFGLLIRFAWLNTLPLVSGDQGWPTASRIKTFYPWPTIWDSTDGLGGINATFNSFRYPMYAVEGWMAQLGAHWSIIERVVMYLPDAIVIPIAGWYLAREVLGNSRWALMGALLFASSTYLIIEGNGEVPLAFGAAVGCFALVGFMRTLRRRSIRWAIATGLLMALTSTIDIRPAFVSALMMALFLLVISFEEPKLRVILSRIGLSMLAGMSFLLTQLFWILPLVFYGSNSQLPVASQPDFNIADLAHGLTGVIAWWTGSNPAPFEQGLLNPIFMVLPLVAMMILVRKRLNAEIVWLALSAMIFAFLAKTNTPPFGFIYNWMFAHIPGFNLFREGSKFLYPIVAAYAVLIPASLQALGEKARSGQLRVPNSFRIVQVGLLSVIIGLSGATLWSLLNGSLLSTTIPTVEPKGFSQLTQMLNRDKKPGQVAWFGGANFRTSDGVIHSYNIASAVHPFDQLNGNSQSLVPAADDPFQNFCPLHGQVYCYLSPTIFPYLVDQSNITYIVSPAGVDVGALPGNITSVWLDHQISSIYGNPVRLGNGVTAIYVWHLKTKVLITRSAPAIALVDSGPWALGGVMPALTALNAPTAYDQTYNQATLPRSPSRLPNSVLVSPYINGGYVVSNSQSSAIMLHETSASVAVKANGVGLTLPRLARPSRLQGWALYGPIHLKAGYNQVQIPGLGSEAAPSVQWGTYAKTLLGNWHSPILGTRLTSSLEKMSATANGPVGPWVELNINYDKGWQLHGKAPTTVGGGLFNLYYAPSIVGHHDVVFQFSTFIWERLGVVVSALVALAMAIYLVLTRKRSRTLNASIVDATIIGFPSSGIAANLGALGVAFLGLTFLAQAYVWLGIPSKFPWAAISNDPYVLNTDFATIALILILLSIFARTVLPLLGRRIIFISQKLGFRKRTGLALTVLAAITSACGIESLPTSSQSLGLAQVAGAPSKTIIGSSIANARQSYVAQNPVGCIENYTIALRSFPSIASIYAGRAACYVSQGINLTAPGLSDMQQASKISPNNPDIMFQLAGSIESIGNLPAAASQYQQLANLPNADDLLIRQAIAGLIHLNQFQAAKTALSIELQKFPNSPISYLAESDYAISQGNESLVLSSVATAQRLAFPGTPDAARVDAYACNIELGRLDYTLALRDCEQALKDGLSSSGVWGNLAAIEANYGNLSQAIIDTNNAIGAFDSNVGPYAQASGVNGFGLSNIMSVQGQYYVEEGKPSAALADFELALTDLPPNSPDSQAQIESDIQSV